MTTIEEHKLLTHITKAMSELAEANIMLEWELNKPKPLTPECPRCKHFEQTCDFCKAYNNAINNIADAQDCIRKSFELERLIID